MKKAFLAMVFIGLVGFCAFAQEDASSEGAGAESFVWWEGENFTKTSTDLKQNPWAKGNDPRKLSESNALSICMTPGTYSKKTFVSWVIYVPKDDTYIFWAREFYKLSASGWKYRFIPVKEVGGELEAVKPIPEFKIADDDCAKYDQLGIGKDRALMWCKYGKIKLKKGKYIFNVKFTSGASGAEDMSSGNLLQTFDVFLLTTQRFTPRGKLKPGESASDTGGNEDDF